MDAKTWFLTKSTAWAYEREWRVLKPVADGSDFDGPSGIVRGLFGLPPDAIEGIILGARADEDLRREMMDLIQRDERYGHAWIGQAELSKTSYEMEIRPLPSNVPTSRTPQSFSLKVVDTDTDEETARTMGAIILEAARSSNLWPLDIEGLRQVTIVEDIVNAVRTMTNGEEEGGERGYFVMGWPEDGLALHLILKRSFLDSLLEEGRSQEERRVALHTIRQSLAHAHDLTQRHRMFGDDHSRLPDHGARGYLVPYVHRTWTRFLIGYATLETFDVETLKSRIEGLVGANDETRQVVNLDYSRRA